jgi:NDP-glycosyltransferase
MAGATYGVPMLCFPMGRDQPMIADRVARLGLGSVLSPEASVSDIQSAIAAILADASTKRRAEDLAKSLAGHPGLDHAVGLVESLPEAHL